jgi:hypothetical protein
MSRPTTISAKASSSQNPLNCPGFDGGWPGMPWVWRSRVTGFSYHGGCVLELYRGEHAKAAVTSLPIVEDLQVLKDRVGQLNTGLPACRSNSSTCIRDQNASIMELS